MLSVVVLSVQDEMFYPSYSVTGYLQKENNELIPKKDSWKVYDEQPRNINAFKIVFF